MYKLNNGSWPNQISDGAFVNPESNQDYLSWCAEGNTPEPADVPPPPTVQEQLAQLDADNTLTQRNLREFILLTTEAIKVATNNAVDLSLIPGVAKVVSVEARAAVLRAKL